ncbi:MAG: cysteinyl-tRNA synthetase [Solirubrobacteraceae bacterium]|jgi:cysteinyl-tRNA synthetase|nr:cysteinyl-tRNA synthetase [Solirubrobacteraceae bacterium]
MWPNFALSVKSGGAQAPYAAAVRTIRLHDTRSGRPTELAPRDPGKVGIYACGPTVYNRIHVGNARPFVVFSLLKRFLAHEGYDPTLVINVTDVNDKIYDAARAAAVPSAQLAGQMTAHYVADTDALGLGRPDHEPLAGQTIDGIVSLIAELIERGAAYAVDGDVYFRVRRDSAYGELSHRPLEAMDQGESDVDPAALARKEDPLDFALWKAQKPGEDTAWDTPWGRGRPGWHIECSAMAEELLGVGFDIHGGGNDLVFPHHENEAAQTRMARGAELARIWMHNGMLQMGGEKMAKSVGNIALLGDVLERWGRDALILFFSTGHYRQPLRFDPSALAQAQTGVRRLRDLAGRLGPGPSPVWSEPLKERFFAALADDFNTPQALAVVWAWVRTANSAEGPVGRDDLAEMLGVLGLENVLEGIPGPPPEVIELAEARLVARAARDFGLADDLRDEIAELGWIVRDTAGGYDFEPAG